LTQCIRDPAYRGMLTEAGLVLATGQKEEAVSKAHPFAQQVTLALATTSQKYSRTPSPALGAKPAGVGKKPRTKSPVPGSKAPKQPKPRPQAPPPTVHIVPPPPARDEAPSPVTPKAPYISNPVPTAPLKPSGLGLFDPGLQPARRSVEAYPYFSPERPFSTGGFAGFTPGSVRTPKPPCNIGCRIDHVGPTGRVRWIHTFPCAKDRDEPVARPVETVEVPLPPAPPARPPKPPRCTYCRQRTHRGPPGDPDSCPAFQDYMRSLNRGNPTQSANTQAQPPSPGNPPRSSEGGSQAGGQEGGGESFDGYAAPEGNRSGNAGGSGGNVGAGGNPGDSDSSDSSDDDADPLPDFTPILGRRKPHWDRAKNKRYDRRLARLAAFYGASQAQAVGNPRSAPGRPKKPEKLSHITVFKGDSTDTNRFLTDVEVQFTYFQKSGLDDMDKIGLVVPLLEGAAKSWYLGIHRHLSQDEAIRMGLRFNPDDPLRTWAGFRQRLEASFGGHEDQDRSLREWMDLTMKPGKVDKYLDKLVDLAAKLGYTDSKQIIDKVRVGISTELRTAWAMKTPHPADVNLYIDMLRQVGHTLQDSANFGKATAKDHGGGSSEKRGDKGSSSKKQRNKEKGSGKQKSRSSNFQTDKQSKPATSAFADSHKGVPDNLVEKRRKNGQCSKCGQAGHFWRKCTSLSPVVHAAKGRNKRSADQAGHTSSPPSKVKRIEAPPDAAGRKLLEVRENSPQIMEVDTDDSDGKSNIRGH